MGKVKNRIFWKVSCSMLVSLISFARISISSTYQRHIEGFLKLSNISFSRSDIQKLLKIGPRTDSIDTPSV